MVMMGTEQVAVVCLSDVAKVKRRRWPRYMYFVCGPLNHWPKLSLLIPIHRIGRVFIPNSLSRLSH